MYQWMLGVWREGGTPQGHVKLLEVMGMFTILTVVMVSWVDMSKLTKLRFKYVPFTISRLYFNKAE